VTLLLILFVSSGGMIVALSLPMIWRKVGPNPWYGFRVPRTLEDPAVWYAVNAYCAKGMLGVGVGTCVLAVVLYLVPGVDLPTYGSVVGAAVLAGIVVTLVLSFRYLAAVDGGSKGGGN
jgi:hypothetical protein